MLKDKPVQQPRVYLNIFSFSFPITAIVSILHRLSGVVLLFMIPVFLGMLQDALFYPWSRSVCSRVLVWLAVSALMYHFLAGVRHLCMDSGLGESKRAATFTSYLVLCLAILFSIFIGMRLC